MLSTISLVILFTISPGYSWNSGNDAVLLSDIKVLTLHDGRMTTARRSSAVPQLKCVGGSAGCGTFVPQVVQCYNRGSDGDDIQWECKSDMDNAYRFGKVEVLCEGYGYPDDPYVLKGSCGLEYTIDLTTEGYQQKEKDSGSHHNYYQGNHSHKKSSGWFGDILFLVIVGVVIYAVYVTCLAPNQSAANPGAPPPYDSHRDHPRADGSPPPYGFRNEYMPNENDGDCTRNRSQGYAGTDYSTPRQHGASTGGGFWTGAGLGGMMGYLFGSRTNTAYGPSYGYGPTYSHRGYGSSWFGGRGNSWFSSRPSHSSSSGFFSSGSGSSTSSSTGTRTASGFGGTRRR